MTESPPPSSTLERRLLCSLYDNYSQFQVSIRPRTRRIPPVQSDRPLSLRLYGWERKRQRRGGIGSEGVFGGQSRPAVVEMRQAVTVVAAQEELTLIETREEPPGWSVTVVPEVRFSPDLTTASRTRWDGGTGDVGETQTAGPEVVPGRYGFGESGSHAVGSPGVPGRTRRRVRDGGGGRPGPRATPPRRRTSLTLRSSGRGVPR